MTEKPENPIYYRFSSGNIIKISVFTVGLDLISLVAAIIMTLRVLPFGMSRMTRALIVMTWLPVIIAMWGTKVWWFDFARFLEASKQIRKPRTVLFYFLFLGMLVFTDTISFWKTDDVRFIMQHVLFTFVLFGGNSVMTVLTFYLNYRHEYPQRAISFLEYCNTPQNIK